MALYSEQKIAICGITGVVGQETLTSLKALDFPVGELHCFASARSAGKEIETPFGPKTIEAFSLESCQGFDFVFLCVGGEFSEAYAKELTKNNKRVIDNSSFFRYDEDVPLIVPEVNPDSIGAAKLIANPNCTTAILAVALYPLHQEFGVKKALVSTYQATSGGGLAAMEELKNETKKVLNGEEASCEKFAHPIPFNLIPAIDKFQKNGYTKEEMKVVWETHKIFGDPNIKISTTAVRIPTFRAHAENVVIETEKSINPEAARAVLEKSDGIKVVDNPEAQEYPMPLTVSKQLDVEVGRIRQNLVFGDHGLEFFICGDQLLKGAALNTVQIALKILEQEKFIIECSEC